MVVALLIVLCAFTACNDEKEQPPEVNELLETAVFFDRGEKILKQEYIDALPWKDEYHMMVEKTTVLIDNKQTLDTMFVGFPTSVDFETERVIVYIHTSYKYGFSHHLADVNVANGACTIQSVIDIPDEFIGENGVIAPCASAPTMRALVVKVNSTEFESAKVKITY